MQSREPVHGLHVVDSLGFASTIWRDSCQVWNWSTLSTAFWALTARNWRITFSMNRKQDGGLITHDIFFKSVLCVLRILKRMIYKLIQIQIASLLAAQHCIVHVVRREKTYFLSQTKHSFDIMFSHFQPIELPCEAYHVPQGNVFW